MQHENITYQADGVTMHSQLFFEPGGAKKAGVVVFPEAFGLGEHALKRAERLAGMGYVALAADYYGDGFQASSLDQALAVMNTFAGDADRTRARGMASLHALVARPEVDPARIASIGFCFGGTMALELARAGADLRAVVGFHSGLGTKGPKVAPHGIKARVLACIGADDPMIPPDQRATFEAEMKEAGADWQMHLYGDTVHSFTNEGAAAANMPQAIRYSPTADARSWAALQELFGETLY